VEVGGEGEEGGRDLQKLGEGQSAAQEPSAAADGEGSYR